MHFVNKTYGHERGLSACFRQWKARSHCQFLHGYALSIAISFQAVTLDGREWVVDFGAMKEVKEVLDEWFDHKTIIAQDDPQLETFRNLASLGVIDLKVMPAVGCEYFAIAVHKMVESWLRDRYLPHLEELGITPPTGLSIHSIEVREHGSNGAAFANVRP